MSGGMIRTLTKTNASQDAVMLQALDAPSDDPAAELIIVIGKPTAPEARLRTMKGPCVIALLGRDPTVKQEGLLVTVVTLEDACEAAIAMLRGVASTPRPFSAPLGRSVSVSGGSGRRWLPSSRP